MNSEIHFNSKIKIIKILSIVINFFFFKKKKTMCLIWACRGKKTSIYWTIPHIILQSKDGLCPIHVSPLHELRAYKKSFSRTWLCALCWKASGSSKPTNSNEPRRSACTHAPATVLLFESGGIVARNPNLFFTKINKDNTLSMTRE